MSWASSLQTPAWRDDHSSLYTLNSPPSNKPVILPARLLLLLWHNPYVSDYR
jgi:hypothetical protein